MEQIMSYLKERDFLGFEAWRWVCLLGSILIGLVVGRIAQFILERSSGKLKHGEEESLATLATLFLQCLGKPAAMFGFVLGLTVGLSLLGFKDLAAAKVESFSKVLYAIAVGYAVYRLVDVLDHFLHRWAAGTESRLDDMLVPMVRKSVRITVVVMVIVFIMNSMFKPEQVATVLTGLGVGGLAVALAAQDSLKNLFGSFMILLDKPFQIGDRVVIGEHDGPVEMVGFRSTKLRTLDGHIVTIPNSTVINEMVRNIGSRPYIRRVSNITITYDTPPEKVRRAVEILDNILDNHEGMDPELPPRVFFSDFNDCSLNIMMIYWYHPPAYWDYLAFTQKVNMEILERFNAEGIDFAFPTQTVYLANDEKRQLALRMLNQPGDSTGA